MSMKGTQATTAGTHTSAPREIAAGIWWLPECLVLPVSGVVTHVHTAPFLIVGSEKTLLWDTGTPTQWRAVEATLGRLLGDRELDYIAPSHPEMAHCGNTLRLLNKYPNARLVGDVRDYPFYFPDHVDRMMHMGRDTALDLGSHRFVFADGVIKDLPSTQWGYEASEQVLFVADGFAYSHQPPLEGDDRPTHLPGECTLFASELGTPPGDEQILWITKAALYWTRFVPFDLLLPSFNELLTNYPTRLLAPAHGSIIDDMDSILWVIWEALRASYDPSAGVRHAGKRVTQEN